MSTITGRLPTCQEVSHHACLHPSLGSGIGQWIMWEWGGIAQMVHLQVLGTGEQEGVFVHGGKGWGVLRMTQGTQFMPLTKEGKPVDTATADTLRDLLDRLAGESDLSDSVEKLEEKIWDHVQWLEKNSRDGANFRHATKVLRLVADFFPHQELPDLHGKSGQFELALGTLTQALTTLKEGISSGVESAMDTIRNQADRFTDQVRVLVHSRNGEVTVVLALNNDHELEILRELGCQPMDVTRVKLGTRLTIKAHRR